MLTASLVLDEASDDRARAPFHGPPMERSLGCEESCASAVAISCSCSRAVPLSDAQMLRVGAAVNLAADPGLLVRDVFGTDDLQPAPRWPSEWRNVS